MKYLPLALLLVAAAPAAAQTARIAHLSHSGSPETLAADTDSDEFGRAPEMFMLDSIVRVSDTTALKYGRLGRGGTMNERVKSVLMGYATKSTKKSPGRAARELQQEYPGIKLVGFDTVTVGVPVKQRRKIRRRRSEGVPVGVVPAPPTHTGGLVLAAGLLVLAGAGWLLGERRVAA